MFKRKKYQPRMIEKKWQKEWQKKKLYQVNQQSRKKKYYCLVEFPYPSGEGLHVGHIRSYTAMDVVARKRRAEGYEVLYPMGWDAFGLPTENYAIKTSQPPALITRRNIARYRKQLQSLGFSFDWSREINTSDSNYYRWTQWMFLQFFKAGLAYKAKMPINWCLKDKIGLANEEVVDGKCERCGGPVETREKEQWLLKITHYADRLDRDLDLVDYPEPIKIQQRNWIGKSNGVLIKFGQIEIFTTRPETIFGATFIARHGAVDRFTGEYAINPANQEKIPIWEAEYVINDVGTGAIMGVPAHDERDREFAQKHNLPVKMSSSADLDTLKKLGARPITTYKLRDWIFSRQRYWGEPIPLVFCNKDGWVAVPDKDLPVKLPPVKKYQPSDTGDSPLVLMESWVKVQCPVCGGAARRETDTMPNWAGSSWYYLAYIARSPTTYNLPASPAGGQAKKLLKKWLPVDWYNGGLEHTTLHLLYSRFWHKALYDLKLAPGKEPYAKRTAHGLILAAGGEKMSKSRGNVVNPDAIVKRFGADTLRVYEMFMGPFGQAISWHEDGLIGAYRFLERVWRLTEKAIIKNESEKSILLNQTIKKVSGDIEQMKFNTAISALMILLNSFEKVWSVSRPDVKIFIKLLSPFAPHLAEELWHQLGGKQSVHASVWPKARLVKNRTVKIAVQINGKTREVFEVVYGLTDDELKEQVLNQPKIKSRLVNKTVKRIIIVPRRLVNFIVDA
ncbi:MAG: leucine--tRNA ligase [Candidatus Vogelbacteria bacterium]|nr:leucine--tRNA ligase [Candidatus Vogelbacteria bacterium]